MNTQLVNSIIQVVRALPNDEQAFLIETLNRLFNYSPPIEASLPPASLTEGSSTTLNEDAWAVWQSLGDDAIPGNLEDASTHHDRYLYSNISEN